MRAGFAGQDNESSLVGILCVVVVAEDALTDAQHHRAVAIYKDAEGGFVVLASELSEQFVVGLLAELLQRRHPPDLIQQGILPIWDSHHSESRVRERAL